MPKFKTYYVYLLSNKNNSVIYTGMTNDIERRVSEHKQKLYPGFTARYNVDKLVYFETFEDVGVAIEREKKLKAGSRKKKLDLINQTNPGWHDLYEDFL